MNNINSSTTEQSIDGQSKISEDILDLESKKLLYTDDDTENPTVKLIRRSIKAALKIHKKPIKKLLG